MPKLLGTGLAVGGAVVLFGSMVSLGYPDVSKWFPVLLIGGGALVWFGIHKYRAAF